MSDQKQTKQFDSKLLNHISEYSLVKYFQQLIISVSIINLIHQQYILPLLAFVNAQILTKSPIYETVNFVDVQADLTLSTFDKYFLEIPKTTVNSFSKTYLDIANKKLIEANNKFLTPIEKSDSVVDTVKNVAVNVKNTAFNKSTEIQKNLVDTYNHELSSAKKQNVIGKNIEASYNTAQKTIKTLNEEIITPLKNQTQDYVDQITTQTKNKADELIKTKVSPKIEEIKKKKDGFLNGNAAPVPVSG